MIRLFGCLFAMTLAIGCGDDSTKTDYTAVAGDWCGKQVSQVEACTGDEVHLLRISQSGSGATGQHCEAYNKDCYPIGDVELSDGKLTYYYGIDNLNDPDRCNVELTVSGTTMTGTSYCTLCDCTTSITVHRL